MTHARLRWIFCAYLIAAVVTFLAYGWDKHRAIQHRIRISERTLHLLELLGGWPGALIAQRYFHHKWKKTSYMAVFWCIVALHCLLWGAWLAGWIAMIYPV